MKFSYKERYTSYILRNFLNGTTLLEKKQPKYKVCVLSNDLIGRSFAVVGAYEEAGVAAVEWLCDQGRIQDSRNCTFVDVGANIGTYSLALSARFETVLAFEPHPVVNKVLSLNKVINGFDNLNVQPYGLSNVDSEAKLYEPAKNVGGSSLEHQGSGSNYTVKIKHASTAINQLKSSKVSFIKMDVEGHELMVMQGLKELLSEDQPVVAFEANDLDRNEQLLKFMKSVGYDEFLALDTKPSIKNPILRVLLLTIIGAKYQLKPIEHLNTHKYSLVFAIPHSKTTGV
jgi:FkbM family methyltransferase